MSDPLPSTEAQRLAALHNPEPMWANELQGKTFTTPRTALPGLLYQGFSILAGAMKSRKSWWALDLGIAVALGADFMGRTCPQGRVLYFDLEPSSSERRTQKRVRDLLTEYEVDEQPWPDRFGIKWQAPRLDEGFIQLLETYLNRYPDTRLVVIDPLQPLRPPGRDEGTYAGDYRFIGALAEVAARRQICLLALHHLRKMPSEEVLYEVSGTTGFTGAADGLLIHKANSLKTGAELFVTGRDIEEDQMLHLCRDPGFVRWRVDPSTQLQSSTERQAVLSVLERNGFPMTVKEMLAVLKDEFSYEALRKLVRKMEKDGELNALSEREGRSIRYIIAPRGGDIVPFDFGAVPTGDNNGFD